MAGGLRPSDGLGFRQKCSRSRAQGVGFRFACRKVKAKRKVPPPTDARMPIFSGRNRTQEQNRSRHKSP